MQRRAPREHIVTDIGIGRSLHARKRSTFFEHAVAYDAQPRNIDFFQRRAQIERAFVRRCNALGMLNGFQLFAARKRVLPDRNGTVRFFARDFVYRFFEDDRFEIFTRFVRAVIIDDQTERIVADDVALCGEGHLFQVYAPRERAFGNFR